MTDTTYFKDWRDLKHARYFAERGFEGLMNFYIERMKERAERRGMTINPWEYDEITQIFEKEGRNNRTSRLERMVVEASVFYQTLRRLDPSLAEVARS
ncbi:MAG: hypothetical protein V1837_03860 [Candidatus Woesearchaeota archaeon]